MYLAAFAFDCSAFDCSAGMNSYELIVELMKGGGFSVVLEQGSYLLLWSCSDIITVFPCPPLTAVCVLSCSDKVFLSYY